MTVQEAIEDIRECVKPVVGGKSLEIAIECMEELEQYRALEEKLNGISIEHIVNAFIERVEKDTNEGYEKGRILTNAEADMWEQYRALGTVEELKEVLNFKKYFDALYGEGLEIANWHKNGDLEPFDSFYESALDWEEGGTSD